MQQAPATPNRTSSYRPNDPSSSSGAQHSSSAAALKGATLAFQGQKKDPDKTPANAANSKPAPRTPNPTARDNGALLAATQASKEHTTPRSRSPPSATKGRAGVSNQATGGSTQERGHYSRDLETGAVAQRLSQFLGSSPAASSPYLLPPSGGKAGPDPKSASFIAATLAASRTGSPAPPTPTFAQAPLSQTQRHARIPRRSSVSNSINSSSASMEEQPDATSIAPMGSLISMFETRRQDTDPIKKGDTADGASGRNGLGTPPRMRSITPPREMSPKRPAARDAGAVEDTAPQVEARKPNPRPKPRSISRFEGEAADSPEIGRTATSGMTTKNKDEARNRTVEKPTLAPTLVSSEALAIPSRPRRSTVDLGRDGADWPLTPTPPAVPKMKPQAKAPPAAHRLSTMEIDSQGESRAQNKSQSQGQKAAQVISSRPAPQPQPKPKPEAWTEERSVTPPEVVRRASTELHSPQPKRVVPNSVLELTTLRARPSNIKSGAKVAVTSQPEALHRERDQKTEPSTIQSLELLPRPSSRNSNSSDDTFVSASSTQSPRAGSPARGREFSTQGQQLRRLSSLHTQLIPPVLARSPSISVTSTTPSYKLARSSTALLSPNSSSNLALDSLTSAMMASNLAASRSASNTSSRSSPIPPPPRRHNQRHSPLHASHTGGSPNREKAGANGTKSPRRMLHTLRAPASLSDDEDARRRVNRHRKKALGGSKKHAHHEGSRRRWRDEVTVKERRRYEALWVSNRGLFLDRAQLELFAERHNVPRVTDQELEPNELVANVVVRDIWSRSRLPLDELAEVWDLVDRGQIGALRRHEFVVGMWLIDQRLRGRKIPATVGESVWDSARDMRFVGPGRGGKKR